MKKLQQINIKNINPYDLNSVSEADVKKERTLSDPRKENPYDLTRDRNKKGVSISRTKLED